MSSSVDGGAVKHDAQKVPYHLLSPVALDYTARVLAFGEKKYAAHNWRKGMGWSRLLRATLGHTLDFMRGEDLDPESGLPHIAHAMCCCMFLLEYFVEKNGTDDRWRK